MSTVAFVCFVGITYLCLLQRFACYMESEYSFDELLCQSLQLFRQYRLYGDEPGCEDKASLMLKEAQHFANDSKDNICMAKWGCVMECLAQNFYISDETDTVLGKMDISLISFWKKAERSEIAVFPFYLWIGYYFLLRCRNDQSVFRGRSKRTISEIVTFLAEVFRKFKNKAIPVEALSFFPADLWGETVCWAELVHDTRVCEKQSAYLLAQLYNLKKAGIQQGESEESVLLQQILKFYCF